jgi:hypothetical protein
MDSTRPIASMGHAAQLLRLQQRAERLVRKPLLEDLLSEHQRLLCVLGLLLEALDALKAQRVQVKLLNEGIDDSYGLSSPI